MAFFKFRFPGKSSETASDSPSTAAGLSVEVLRRRARHRLLGSVVLVFVAVVAFPLWFDSQPRPVAVDTPVVIPDRQSTPPLSAGGSVPAAHNPAPPLLPPAVVASEAATSAAAAPAKASNNVPSNVPKPVPAQASLEPGKEVLVAPSGAGSVANGNALATKAEAKPELKPEAKPQAKPDVKADNKADLKAQAKADAHAPEASKDSANAQKDADKAKALLEGKSPTASSHERVIVQVGAFADADKVRELRRKLEQAGLKTFVQNVELADGKRSTRVRVGPFDSRAEAEKAAARIRKLDLPAHIMVL